MMTGEVEASGDAVIAVNVRGPGGTTIEARAVIDTGFNDYLTLPLTTIEYLQLIAMEEVRYSLADGSETLTRVFAGEIEWFGEWRPILVVAMEATPLLGMAALRGSSLRIDVVDGGRVEIRPIGA